MIKKHYWILHYIGDTVQYSAIVSTDRKYINIAAIECAKLKDKGYSTLASVSYLGKMTYAEFNSENNENTN